MMHHSSRSFLILSLCLLVAGLLSTHTAKAQPGNWEAVQGFTGIPGERHENGFLQVGDKFILIGGRNSEWKLTEHYDFATNSWAQGAFHPIRMHHIQAVEIDGLVYVVGAMTGNFPDETPIQNVYVYDPLSANWYMGAEIPAARRRGSCGVVVYNNLIYVISGLTMGHNAGHVVYTDVYDPSTNTWTALADAPRARDHFNAVVVGDQIYCIGGRRSKHSTTGLNSDMVAIVDVYDIPTDTWTSLATPLPTVRAGTSSAVIGNQIYTMGGESMTSGAHKETEVLDIITKTWIAGFDTLTDPRHGTQAIVNNDVIYTSAGSRANTVEILPSDTAFIERFSPTGIFTPPTAIPYIASQLTTPVATYDFGNIITGTTASAVITLSNVGGTQAILLTALNISGADSTLFDFGVMGNDPFQPVTIPPGGSIDITLTFSPDVANSKSATFTYWHSGSNGTQVIPLTGEGCVGIPGGPNGAFIESDSTLMMEVESEIPEVGSDWAQGVDGSTVYYEWTGANNFVTPPVEKIQYEFTINTPGIYRVVMRSQQFDFSLPVTGNDVWMEFPNADARRVKGTFPIPDENLPLVGPFKVYQNDVVGWTWYTSAEEYNDVGIYLDITVAGTYNMNLFGRSTGFKVDKFVFYTYQQALTDAELDALAESTRITTTCLKTWYQDLDLDTFGNDSVSINAVIQPAGYVAVPGDCADNNPAINPSAVELLDGLDNDCDTQVDEGWLAPCETVRINCGSDSSITTTDGRVFMVDNFYSANTSTYGDGSLAIANTTEDGLYQTTRSSDTDLAGFNYNIPVVNGPYQVILHFAEIFFGVGTNGGGLGTRVFDISLEGVIEQAAFDILADPQSGGSSATAVQKTFTTTVFDETMNIFLDASTGANRPKISAIELIPQVGCGIGTIFPIELAVFEAKRLGDGIAIRWETTSEINNDYFTIERSSDGAAFREILRVDALGNSQELATYNAMDTEPIEGLNYYRLKQTDVDGKFTYSQVVLVAFYRGGLNVYPNPLRKGEALTVTFDLTERTQVSFRLNNMLGQQIFHQRKDLAKGSYEEILKVRDLRQGYYILTARIGQKTIVQKIAVFE